MSPCFSVSHLNFVADESTFPVASRFRWARTYAHIARIASIGQPRLLMEFASKGTGGGGGGRGGNGAGGGGGK